MDDVCLFLPAEFTGVGGVISEGCSLRPVPRGSLLNEPENAEPVMRKPFFAGVGGGGVDLVEVGGGLAVVHLCEGAGFD